MAVKTAVKIQSKNNTVKLEKKSLSQRFWISRYLLILALPGIIYYLLFDYLPMWGVLMAFKKYSPFKGFWGSPWVGLKYFKMFFDNTYTFRLITNTFLLSLYSLLWGFPVPIIFALILNEVRNLRFKKLVQTVSYMPHFISTVVVVSMVTLFLSPINGPVNNIINSLGHQKISFMGLPQYFRTIYISTSIWQNMGWGAIIYLAAISNIDPQLYEAAIIDGATKLQRVFRITIPCLAPTIITLFLLRTGALLNIGFEKAFLMQTPATYQTSDVITTFVYRQGIKEGLISYGTAVGLFNSLVNLSILFFSNHIAKRYSETSLW